MTDKVYLAENAARLLAEVQPYLDKMERDAIEEALSCDRTTAEGQAAANDALRRVVILRGLASKMKIEIASGKIAADREATGRQFA